MDQRTSSAVNELANRWESFVPYRTGELLATTPLTVGDLKDLVDTMLDRAATKPKSWAALVKNMRNAWPERMPATVAGQQSERKAIVAILADAIEYGLQDREYQPQEKAAIPTLAQRLSVPLHGPRDGSQSTTVSWADVYAKIETIAKDSSLPEPLRALVESHASDIRTRIAELNLPATHDAWDKLAESLAMHAQLIEHRLLEPNLIPSLSSAATNQMGLEQLYITYLARALEPYKNMKPYPNLDRELQQARNELGAALHGPERTTKPEDALEHFVKKVASIRKKVESMGADMRWLEIIDMERDLVDHPDLTAMLRQARKTFEDSKDSHYLQAKDAFAQSVAAVREQALIRGVEFKPPHYTPQKHKTMGFGRGIFAKKPKKEPPLLLSSAVEGELSLEELGISRVEDAFARGTQTTDEALLDRTDINRRVEKAQRMVKEVAGLLTPTRRDDYRDAYAQRGLGDALLQKRSFIASRIIEGQSIYGQLDGSVSKRLSETPVLGQEYHTIAKRARMFDEMDLRRVASQLREALRPLVTDTPPERTPRKVKLIDNSPDEPAALPTIRELPEYTGEIPPKMAANAEAFRTAKRQERGEKIDQPSGKGTRRHPMVTMPEKLIGATVEEQAAHAARLQALRAAGRISQAPEQEHRLPTTKEKTRLMAAMPEKLIGGTKEEQAAHAERVRALRAAGVVPPAPAEEKGPLNGQEKKRFIGAMPEKLIGATEEDQAAHTARLQAMRAAGLVSQPTAPQVPVAVPASKSNEALPLEGQAVAEDGILTGDALQAKIKEVMQRGSPKGHAKKVRATQAEAANGQQKGKFA